MADEKKKTQKAQDGFALMKTAATEGSVSFNGVEYPIANSLVEVPVEAVAEFLAHGLVAVE